MGDKATLVSALAERIHAKIALGEYQVGSRLRQEDLAKAFKVSRTPVREALRQLEAKGVISHAHGHSAVIRAASPREIREIYQIRAELEGFAAQLAAQWITDEQLARLRKVHEDFVLAIEILEKQGNSQKPRLSDKMRASRAVKFSKGWIETNAAFHTIIHEASNSQSLRKFIGDLALGYTRSIMLSSAMGMDMHRMRKNIKDHEVILRGLEKRDPTEARRAMSLHIRESGEFLVAWFENHSQMSDGT
jgi:DNA-binding GntR family transcriptional regulator